MFQRKEPELVRRLQGESMPGMIERWQRGQGGGRGVSRSREGGGEAREVEWRAAHVGSNRLMRGLGLLL